VPHFDPGPGFPELDPPYSPERIPILMYHHVGPVPPVGLEQYSVTPARFERQLELLRRLGYRVISLGEVLGRWMARSAPVPERSVVLTFDDGYRDCVDHAVPILTARGLSATFFLVTGDMGRPGRWLSRESSPLYLMGWDSAHDLLQSGFSVGSHTVTHASLLELSPSRVDQELRRSKEDLEDKLGVLVEDFSYPFGIATSEIINATQAAGYRSAVTTAVALADRSMGRFFLPRVPVQGGDRMWDFAFRLRWAHRPLDHLLASPASRAVRYARRLRRPGRACRR
jgi:peptidoglycan/xylan/chitin deacetylase (PgdA/CDA1 family)